MPYTQSVSVYLIALMDKLLTAIVAAYMLRSLSANSGYWSEYENDSRYTDIISANITKHYEYFQLLSHRNKRSLNVCHKILQNSRKSF